MLTRGRLLCQKSCGLKRGEKTVSKIKSVAGSRRIINPLVIIGLFVFWLKNTLARFTPRKQSGRQFSAAGASDGPRLSHLDLSEPPAATFSFCGCAQAPRAIKRGWREGAGAGWRVECQACKRARFFQRHRAACAFVLVESGTVPLRALLGIGGAS